MTEKPKRQAEEKSAVDDLGEALEPLIRAQNEARDAALKEASLRALALEEEQKQSLYELRRAKAAEELSSTAGQSVQEVKALRLAFEYLATEVRELTQTIETELNAVGYRLGLLVEINRLLASGVKTREEKQRLSQLVDEIDQLDFDQAETEELALRKRIKWLYKTLRELQIREAMYGSTAIPVHIINEIDDTREKIAKAEAELNELLRKRKDEQAGLQNN